MISTGQQQQPLPPDQMWFLQNRTQQLMAEQMFGGQKDASKPTAYGSGMDAMQGGKMAKNAMATAPQTASMAQDPYAAARMAQGAPGALSTAAGAAGSVLGGAGVAYNAMQSGRNITDAASLIPGMRPNAQPHAYRQLEGMGADEVSRAGMQGMMSGAAMGSTLGPAGAIGGAMIGGGAALSRAGGAVGYGEVMGQYVPNGGQNWGRHTVNHGADYGGQASDALRAGAQGAGSAASGGLTSFAENYLSDKVVSKVAGLFGGGGDRDDPRRPWHGVRQTN